MLIVTKDEVCERISCFEKLIGAYNKKIEFLQKILLYFEKTSKNIDCLVVNVSVQEIPSDLFAVEDQIEMVRGDVRVIDNQENQLSFTSHPLSVVNTSNSWNAPMTVILPKVHISSEISHKNHNGSHACQISSVTLPNHPTITKHSNSKPFNSLEESRKNIFIVPKLELLKTAHNQVEPMEVSCDQMKDGETIAHKEANFKIPNSTTNTTKNDLRIGANIFLCETDLETAEVPSQNLAIKNSELSLRDCDKARDVKLKQFRCEMCSSAFAQKGVLNRHRILRHSPIVNKPHVCPNCRKAFTLKHHLKNHLKCKSGCRSNNEFRT